MRKPFTRAVRHRASIASKIIFWILLIVVLVVGFYAQNNVVVSNDIIFESTKIPKTFVGYKVVQVSDLMNDPHNALTVIEDKEPDLIVVTGNLCSSNGAYKESVGMLNRLSDNFKIVYVLGESDGAHGDAIKATLDPRIEFIEDSTYVAESPEVDSEEFIKRYIGMKYIKKAEDATTEAAKYIEYTKWALEKAKDKTIEFTGLGVLSKDTDFVEKTYSVINKDRSIFRTVVMNQGKFFQEVSQVDVDVVMAGNTFGKETKEEEKNRDKNVTPLTRGIYSRNNTTLFLSGGIGNSKDKPYRIFNLPQIITITLSDGTIRDTNPLEKLLGMFIDNDSTLFENDRGFKENRNEYLK